MNKKIIIYLTILSSSILLFICLYLNSNSNSYKEYKLKSLYKDDCIKTRLYKSTYCYKLRLKLINLLEEKRNID